MRVTCFIYPFYAPIYGISCPEKQAFSFLATMIYISESTNYAHLLRGAKTSARSEWNIKYTVPLHIEMKKWLKGAPTAAGGRPFLDIALLM